MRRFYSLTGGAITDENGTSFSNPALMVEPLVYGENYSMIQIKLSFYANIAAVERGNRPLVVPGMPWQFVIDTEGYFKDMAELPAVPFGLGDLVTHIIETETGKYLARIKVNGTLAAETVNLTNSPGPMY